MPFSLQAKLLRVLQEKEYQRIGSNETVKVDFRLVATTNIDLKKAVQEGKFREDLFYRLNVIPLQLPPLCERREDISVLAFHFMRRFSAMHGKKIDKISRAGLRFLLQADWKGNVRELENTIERAVVMCQGDQLDLHDFFVIEKPPEVSDLETALPSLVMVDEQASLADLEKKHILNTLKNQGGHRARTADILGISIRTLRNKLNEYREKGEVF